MQSCILLFSKQLARKVLREIFEEKIESEGEIDTLCFQVSISQEITSSEIVLRK